MGSDYSFNKSNISDQEILAYLNQRENITTISFISPYSGIPHTCPVWGIFHEGSYYFQTEDYSFKVKFIQKGNNKVGVSIVDPSQFPDYSKGKIPYISLGGTAKVRSKDKFEYFKTILEKIFIKYIKDEEERKKTYEYVLNEVDSRVLIEVEPEWVKVIKVP